MVVVKLKGGLGNQMFQYAAAKGLKATSKIYLDLSFLKKHALSTPNFTPRAFELSLFSNIKLHFAGWVKKLFFLKPIIITDDNAGVYFNKSVPGQKNFYLDGYFQDEKYFSSIRSQLLKDFEFQILTGNALEWAKKITNSTNSVSVHIRRGDYLKPEVEVFHGILPASYYQEAKNIMGQKIAQPNYFIFSDDTAWCKANLSFFDETATVVIITDTEIWEDMCLMSLCKHHIIANSSYSWWGAWLNKSEDKIVIAPNKWFVNEPTNIVPKEWIKI